LRGFPPLERNKNYVLANRAIALTGLNRWEESLISLEDALKKLDEGEQANLKDTELILRILFTNTAQTNIWKNYIQFLIQLFHQYKSLSLLSQGIVRNIPTLMSETVSNKAVETWLQIWQELAANYPEFEVALRLLSTAVRYRENNGDRRVLLELAIEERKLLEDILNVNKPPQ
jgi:tetratricopeptide (TPR) repeat protein